MYLTTHAQTLFGSNIEEAYSSAEVAELLDSIQRICDHMKESHQTAKLWIQYFELLQILRLFVRSERSGGWHLHLYAVQQMRSWSLTRRYMEFICRGEVGVPDFLKD